MRPRNRIRSSKAMRQDAILDLILRETIATQEELVSWLQKDGFEITQATVSRDIKEMKIIKVTLADGRQKYVSMSGDRERSHDRLIKVFTQAATEARAAGSLVVIHTLSGMAPAAASAIDAMRVPEIVGTIAGDDTIFIASVSEEAARLLVDRLSTLIGASQA